jgi:hypothetical protein
MLNNDTVHALLAALQVITRTPHIRAYLTEHDPKALQQADKAIHAATGETPAALVRRLTDEQRVQYATNPNVMQHGPTLRIRDDKAVR